MSIDINGILAIFSSLGYLGIFLISFIGSIIIFVPIPYFPILIVAAFSQHLNPNIICLLGAIGTTSAKMIIFYASYYESNIFGLYKKKNILPLERLLRRYAWIGAFTAALVPIPDIVSVPMGMVKYSPWKFASAIFIGKFMFNMVIVWAALTLGRTFVKHLGLLVSPIANTTISNPLNLSIIGVTAAGIAIVVIIIYMSFRIDWGKIIGKWFPWTVEENEKEEKEEK